MIYSSTCAYAIRAMMRLADLEQQQEYVLLDALCEGSDLPRQFVAKIFQKLVHAGLLRSAKGRGGGFALARPAEQITLHQIVEAVDGMDRLEACVLRVRECGTAGGACCAHHRHWEPIRRQIRSMLRQTTLASLVAGHAEPAAREAAAEPAIYDRRLTAQHAEPSAV